MAGGIAHDFNYILSAVLGYAKIAQTEAEKGTGLYRNMQEILQAGGRAIESKRISPDTPVMLSTRYSARINQEQAVAMGIRAFVSKPVLSKEIAKTISGFGRQLILTNSPEVKRSSRKRRLT